MAGVFPQSRLAGFALQFLGHVGLCIFTLRSTSWTSASELTTKNTTLELVQLLFRHGDRSPISTFPSDKYQVDQWNYGWGELTDLGAQQAFDLGRYLRDHYLEFGLRNIADHQVFVRSTFIPRAIMTANCVMAGILRPDNVKTFNPRKETQPVTVHHPAEDDDQLLSMAPCPLTGKLQTVWKNTSPVWASYLKKTQELFSFLSKNTGFAVSSSNIVSVVDAVFCEMKHNLTLAPWLSPQIVSQLMDVFNESSAYVNPTQELQKLAAGPLLEKMLKNIHQKIIKKDDKMKLFVYSAHDTNVLSFLSVLEVFNNIQPPYVSCVMVELHREDKTYYVKFQYRNDTTKPPYLLKIPGCEELCPIASLHKLLQNVTLEAEDRASVCGPIPGSTKLKENVVPIAIAGMLIFAVIIVALVVYVVHRRRKKQNTECVNYRQLLQDSEASLLDSDDDELL